MCNDLDYCDKSADSNDIKLSDIQNAISKYKTYVKNNGYDSLMFDYLINSTLT